MTPCAGQAALRETLCGEVPALFATGAARSDEDAAQGPLQRAGMEEAPAPHGTLIPPRSWGWESCAGMPGCWGAPSESSVPVPSRPGQRAASSPPRTKPAVQRWHAASRGRGAASCPESEGRDSHPLPSRHPAPPRIPLLPRRRRRRMRPPKGVEANNLPLPKLRPRELGALSAVGGPQLRAGGSGAGSPPLSADPGRADTERERSWGIRPPIITNRLGFG